MPIPALLGLLAGGGIAALDSKIKRNRAEELGQQIGGLLGAPRTDFEQELFPGESPIPGLQNKGSGLLDDPFNPENQARFAGQVATLPGMADQGLSMLQQIFGNQTQAQTSALNNMRTNQLNQDKWLLEQMQKMNADADKMRGEYTKGVGDFAQVQTSYKDLSKLSDDQTGASALGMVYRFIKTLDPRGIVTDSEGNQVLGVGGAAEMFSGIVNDIKGKGKLTPETRAQIVNTAGILYENQLDLMKNKRLQMGKLAEERGLKRSQVLTGTGVDWGFRHTPVQVTPPAQQKIFQGQPAPANRKQGQTWTDPAQPGWEFRNNNGRIEKRRITNPAQAPMPGYGGR